jgi:mannose-1-phosphate guanylyltransferase
MSVWAVVLAGGVGSRFWPLSTPRRPKQLLPLAGERPLLRDALERLAPLVPPERTLILTNAQLAADVRALAPEVPGDQVLAEPRPAGTAAALAWAARLIAERDGGDAVMTCTHADWAIADPERFRVTLRRAIDAARAQRALVTVGIVPGRPETGYGYIAPGEPVYDGARRVARFVEKPDAARAAELRDAGYLWNSGIFVWRVDDFLAELDAHTPEVAPALRAASDANAFFAAVQSISVDVGVLERSARVLVVPGDFGWDDVGTWEALGRIRPSDAAGNASSGTVYAVEASDNVVHAEEGAVVLYGVSGLVVVQRAGLTFVTTKERAADLKTLVEALPSELRELP